jgi:hypothetical protein
MNKKFLLILLPLLLLLAACRSSEPIDSDPGPATAYVHWQQNVQGSLERQIEVIVPAQFASDGNFMSAVNVGMQQANRSPYINTVLNVPNTLPTSGCLSLSHCVTIQRKVMNGGLTSFGWGAGGHMYGRAASIWIDSNPWNLNVLKNALCHELYHALGLAHSKDGTQGPCQDAIATSVDLANIKLTTAHFDVVFGGPMVQAQTKVKLTKSHATSRAEFERMAKHGAS